MYSSFISRSNVYIGAATLAAHASYIREGFRIRDMLFFTELFLNWNSDFEEPSEPFQATQISRYLDKLVVDGFARRSGRGRIQLFRLTRLGLLELVGRLADVQSPLPIEQTLFRIYFLKGYRPWLERLVKDGQSLVPPALAIELAALLDVETVVEHEIKRFERSLLRVEKRISDAQETSALVKNRLNAGVPFEEVVNEVERRFPYELNSMKPLGELISSIEVDQRPWELQSGNLLRVSTLWEPQRMLLKEVLRQLRTIRSDCRQG
jgi:hypothetical protein